MAELKKYVSGLNSEQEKIFVDCFKQYRWNKIREKLGLGDFKFHDLRKTFGSVLAQNGVSTAVTQKLLEHSSPDLTNKKQAVERYLEQATCLHGGQNFAQKAFNGSMTLKELCYLYLEYQHSKVLAHALSVTRHPLCFVPISCRVQSLQLFGAFRMQAQRFLTS